MNKHVNAQISFMALAIVKPGGGAHKFGSARMMRPAVSWSEKSCAVMPHTATAVKLKPITAPSRSRLASAGPQSLGTTIEMFAIAFGVSTHCAGGDGAGGGNDSGGGGSNGDGEHAFPIAH